ncbi:MAG: UDP-N-acetylmuramoyl-L-alanine--D-glutamate ligase [Clostridia bacterium]|nr:UDP-N-acetylmuramoyl-L-alanine--D-glutamate ligase [Clostridia bacterium]
MEYINEKLEEFNNYLNRRKVAIIGLGVSNLPLLDYLYEHKAKVTVFDDKEIDQIPKEVMDKITKYTFKFSLGKNSLSKLVGFDFIFRSPSCLPTNPALSAEIDRGSIVTTEVEMLMKIAPCKIIGITGSDGKTTTTSLIYEILKKAGYKCYLGGNIGYPLFTRLNEIRPEDILILELSSFQLMGMDFSPEISVVTNITPNHLNIHKDYDEYIEAKKNIFKYQNQDGILVTNYDNEVTKQISKEANGKVIYFSSKKKLDNGYIVDGDVIKECDDKLRKHILNVKEVKLKGTHNYENICTALAATRTLVDMDTAISAVKEFSGVEHRIEFIREVFGVKWYNDSASSSPTRTISGLKAFDEEIVLIAGGYDKNLDYTPMAKTIIDKVKTLILLGQTSGKIFNVVKAELDKQGKKLDIYMCDNLSDTVTLARKHAKAGQIVLFSPASASFDMFKNFADRGDKFKKLVKEI